MENCDTNGPLCIYISKIILINDGRLAAYGRIFPGTLKTGKKIRIMGTNYKAGHKTELYEKNVGQVGIFLLATNP